MGYRALTLPAQTAQHLADLTADEFRVIARRRPQHRSQGDSWDYTFGDPVRTYGELRDEAKIVVHHMLDAGCTVLVARLARAAVSPGPKNSRGRR